MAENSDKGIKEQQEGDRPSNKRKKLIDFDQFGRDFEKFVENINPFKLLQSPDQKSTPNNLTKKADEIQSEQFSNEWAEYSENTQKQMELAQEQKFHSQNEQLMKRIKNPKRLERRQKVLKRRQQLERERLKEFFTKQQELFRQKLREMEDERKEKLQQIRQIEKTTQEERRLQNQAIVKENRELQRKIREHRKALRIKRMAARRARQQMGKEIRKEYLTETQQIRQQSWNRFLRQQRRRTERFVKFSNRLWWRGYLTLLGWIVGIFLILMGIFYIFKFLGIDLIELMFQYTSNTG